MRIVFAAMFVAGCATTTPTVASAPAHAPVTVTQVNSETRLCLDHSTLQAGQQVRFKRHVCAWVPPKNIARTCHDEPVETADVVRVIDDHCVIVVAPAGAQFQAGDEIEITAVAKR